MTLRIASERFSVNMTETAEKTLYFGAFVQSSKPTQLEICETGAIGVDVTGKIVFIERDISDVQTVLDKHSFQHARIVKVPGSGFFFPGFIGMLSLSLSLDNQQHEALANDGAIKQIHTSMPRNTQMPASLANPPS